MPGIFGRLRIPAAPAKPVDLPNSGNISREETHILMNRGSAEEPLVEKQIEPQVRGVMVLCEGAENPVVERRITEAVRTVLGIPTSRICVEKISN